MRLLPAHRDGGPTLGQALVELALIAPILCLLMLGAIDLGRVWYSQITIENAAREGAMEGMFQPTSFLSGQPCTSGNQDTNRIMCRVLNETRDSQVTVDPADVSKSCSAACAPGTTASPNRITVRVEGEFSLLTPLMSFFFGGQTITLAAEAEANIVMTPTVGAATTPSPTPSPTPTPAPSSSASASASASAGASASPTPTPTPTPQPCVAPVANFTVSPSTGIKNKTTFQFTSTSTGMSNPACNPIWSWSFGDGSGASSAQNPSYKFSKQGSYKVTLTVSNSMGQSTKEVTVVVTNN